MGTEVHIVDRKSAIEFARKLEREFKLEQEKRRDKEDGKDDRAHFAQERIEKVVGDINDAFDNVEHDPELMEKDLYDQLVKERELYRYKQVREDVEMILDEKWGKPSSYEAHPDYIGPNGFHRTGDWLAALRGKSTVTKPKKPNPMPKKPLTLEGYKRHKRWGWILG